MSKILFTLAVIALLLFAFLLVLPTLLLPNRLKEKGAYDKEKQDNILAGKERMQALRESVAAGELTEEEASEYQLEIEKTLLRDVDAAPKNHLKANETILKADWPICLVTALSLLLFTPILYVSIGTPEAIDSPPNSLQTDTNNLELNNEIGIQKIQERLDENPNDLEALIWMGRLQTVAGQYSQAQHYFERALAVDDTVADIYASYVDVLMSDSTTDNNKRIAQLLRKGLSLDSSHPILLWLSGIFAENNGDTKAAIAYWKKAHLNMADSPDAQKELIAIIADAQLNLQAKPSQQDININAPNDSAADNSVVVIVKEGRDNNITAGGEILFIFAKAIGDNAPRLPLAVSRQEFSGFPITATLNDSLAMVPTIKMSQFTHYDIIARLSKTGNAQATSGDFFGMASDIKTGDTITIHIDDVTP